MGVKSELGTESKFGDFESVPGLLALVSLGEILLLEETSLSMCIKFGLCVKRAYPAQ